MTIALGILAGNSQIIAADTQMSTETEKFTHGKISYRLKPPHGERERWLIAITGSGDAAYLSALQQELSDTFMALEEVEHMKAVQAALGKKLKSFYRDHIAITPHPAERPEVELIIAARCGPLSQMWVTKRNHIGVAQSPVAVGIGESYARAILGTLGLPQSPETAMILAAYVAFQVKLRNPWVGMDTEVFCLDDLSMFQPKGFGRQACRRLEEIFRTYSGVEARALHRFFGSAYDFCEPDSILRDIETLRKRLDDFLHPSSSTKSESSQT